jgi:hypothetical protein
VGEVAETGAPVSAEEAMMAAETPESVKQGLKATVRDLVGRGRLSPDVGFLLYVQLDAADTTDDLRSVATGMRVVLRRQCHGMSEKALNGVAARMSRLVEAAEPARAFRLPDPDGGAPLPPAPPRRPHLRLVETAAAA